jgi:MFS family permease
MIWLVSIASFITLFITSGIMFSYFVFLKPVGADLGLSSITLLVIFFISILLAGFTYFVAKRFSNIGFKMALSICILLLGVGCIIIVLISNLGQLLVVWGIVIGFGIGSNITSVVSALQKWLPGRKGFKAGIYVAGIGLGILAGPLILNQFSMNYGWRAAFIIIGPTSLFVLFLMVIVFIVATLLKRNKPSKVNDIIVN